MILIYNETETTFNTNGYGCLNDVISCEVKEVINGEYELEMEYPITGIHYSDIMLNRLILAKPNAYDQEQPFRIYSISKPMNGIVTVLGEHISYDMSGLPVKGKVENYAYYVNEVFNHIRNNSIYPCPFVFSSDITEEKKEINLSKPRSIRSYLGDEEGLLSVFGGEWEFDRFRAILHRQRGTNRGVVIEYGKNLIDLKQEEKNSSMYTAVYPFYYREDDGLQTLSENCIALTSTGVNRVLNLDLTSEFEEMPTETQLREKTNEYILNHKLKEPDVSLTVSFIKNPEVIEALQDVRLGDTVTVKFLKLGVNAASRCISYTFNVITEKYESIELGSQIGTLVNTVVDTSKNLISEVNRATQKERFILHEVDDVNNTLKSTIKDTALGLQSQITQNAGHISAEVTRATNAEQNIISKIDVTDSTIQAEVTRATGMEEALSSRIQVNADQIIAEVTRASAAEGVMSTRITATENGLTSKVTKGDVCSEINQSSDTIYLRSNRLVVDSTNFGLTEDGDVRMSGEVYANTGRIGDFYIRNGKLENDDGTSIYYNGITTDIIIANSGITTDNIFSNTQLDLGVSATPLRIMGSPVTIYGGGNGIDINSPIYINDPGSSTADPNTRIQNNSNRLAISATSSKRYKHDIQKVINPELDPHRLYDIEIVQYKYNLDYVDPSDQRYNTMVIGMTAEDVYEKYPIAAELDMYGNTENWSARYLIPPMLSLIQEQHEEIDDMKKMIMILEGRISLIEQKIGGKL